MHIQSNNDGNYQMYSESLLVNDSRISKFEHFGEKALALNAQGRTNRQEMNNQSPRSIIQHRLHHHDSLHKANIGGSKSSFSPVVKLPSKEVIGGIIHSNRQSHHSASRRLDYYNTKQEYAKSNVIILLHDILQNNDTNAIQPSRIKDYHFCPIISEDERYQINNVQQIADPTRLKKEQKLHQIPVLEITFDDDVSLGSVSSMGYDGSEHDIEAIFKYAYMHPAYYDTPYDIRESFEDVREIDDDNELRQENIVYDDDRTISIQNDVDQKHFEQRNKIVDAIVQDPDLSIAQSSIEKSTIKDPNLSQDGDETNCVSAVGEKGEINTWDVPNTGERNGDSNEHEYSSHSMTKSSLQPTVEDTLLDSNPPISEINIPTSHNYGYGFYLKPLWNIENRNLSKQCNERLQKVRNLLKEGRERRQRKELVKKYVYNLTAG